MIKRLLQPTIIQNEKDVNYTISSLQPSEVKRMLSTQYVGGGIFGLESIYTPYQDNTIFFCQPHFKVDWDIAKHGIIFNDLLTDDVTYAQFYTTKPSIYPISMNYTGSFWKYLCSLTNKNMSLMYQLLLVYRQDNWIERLQEMYDDYCLNGIETPSNNKLFRKIQRSFNEKIDSLLNWDYRHLPIQEFEDKINENGFRVNIRLIIRGDTERERKKVIEEFKYLLNEHSYMNNWDYITSKLAEVDIGDIQNRRLNNIGKSQVLTVSELIPFITLSETFKEEDYEEVNSVIEPIVDKVDIGNNLIEMLPRGDKLEDVDASSLVEKFIHALKEVKGVRKQLAVKKCQSGSTLMKMTFDIPKGIKFSELIKKNVIDDLQAFMGVKGLQIEQGDIGEFNVVLPLPERRKVYLRDYIDAEEFYEFNKESELGFLAGVSEIGEPIYKDLAKAPHLLVAGTTGGGKSTFLHQLLTTLLLTKTPKELILYLIDIKRVELNAYKSFPHVPKIEVEAGKAIELLQQLINESNRRYKMFEEIGVRDIKQYNKKVQNKIPYILCVIDEYAELSLREKEVHDYVQSLCQLSRACGVVMILSTQRPSANIIPSEIRDNLPSKIAFKCANTRSYLVFLNSKPPFNLLGNGDGCMSYEGDSEYLRFQSCLITDDDEIELIESIGKKMKYGKTTVELPEVIDEEEESDVDRLKRAIINHNTTKISELRNIMKININRLNDLMKELCEENFLKAPEYKSQGYQLIASEEEIAKWKE